MEPNRVAYGRALEELGIRNPRVIALDADIQKSTNTSAFAARFPERHFNVGIAEQNMMAIAAGAATTGWIPFAHTFAVFASMRNVTDDTDDVEVAGPSTPPHAQFRSRQDFGSLWTIGLKGTF